MSKSSSLASQGCYIMYRERMVMSMEWILVGDRLPREGESVLITVRGMSTVWMSKMSRNIYSGKLEWDVHWNPNDVIAWMPIPVKPYVEGAPVEAVTIEAEPKCPDKERLIKFFDDFAGNWRAEDVVSITDVPGDSSVYLVDGVAAIDKGTLFQYASVINEV